ncbi:MAG: DNA alkylation repair protein [Peptostreptococcaceae bacterium]|nr:DNA alkylation repair protein [Peptostreptococcaceae bacterium]
MAKKLKDYYDRAYLERLADLIAGECREFDRETFFELTKRFTSEYCMRPLIRKYPEESLKILLDWSRDDNERVRRLSGECLRIRLPWAKKLYTALEYFEQYVKILTHLKDDTDKYIQKTAANNLNDLYKEAPEKFYEIIDTWKKGEIGKECEWVIKHGSRTVRKRDSQIGSQTG